MAFRSFDTTSLSFLKSHVPQSLQLNCPKQIPVIATRRFLPPTASDLARASVLPSHGRLLALSAATGALILIWADVLARTLLSSGQELPVGVVSALLGGPFFFYLLKSRRSRGMW